MTDPSTIPLAARQEITRRFDELAIFKRPRDAALYNYCAVLETHVSPISDNPEIAYASARQALEASFRAIPAIFTKCPPAFGMQLRINPAVYQEASEMFHYSFLYDQVMTCFDLAIRDQFDVRFDPLSKEVVFTYTSAQESSTDTLLRSGELIANRDDTATDY